MSDERMSYREVMEAIQSTIDSKTDTILKEIREVKEHQKEQNGRVFKNAESITIIKNNFKWIKGGALMLIPITIHYFVQFLIWVTHTI